MNISAETNLSSTSSVATPQSHGFKFFSVAIYAAIIAVAFIGNSLACLAFIVSPIVRRPPTNHFIFSLAVGDLLTVCFSVPFDLEQTLKDFVWSHGEVLCVVWTSSYLLTVPSSIWSLLAVSVDRYKSIKDPLNRFRQAPFMTRKRAGIVILALWVYSGIFALMPVMGWKRASRSVEKNFCDFNITLEYSLLSSIINFVLPTIFMCILYWRIYKIARGVARDAALNLLESSSSARERDAKTLRKRIKTTKNILVVAWTFFFCWMPHTLFSIASAFMYTWCMKCLLAIPRELFVTLLMLGYTSSALNPYLYALRNKQFKRALLGIVPAVRRRFENWTSLNSLGNRKTTSTRLHEHGVTSTSV